MLTVLMLAVLAVQPAAAQTFGEEVSSPDGLSTGLAIILVGILAILVAATLSLNSPVALLAMAASFMILLLVFLGEIGVRAYYLTATLHGLTLAATGVFKE